MHAAFDHALYIIRFLLSLYKDHMLLYQEQHRNTICRPVTTGGAEGRSPPKKNFLPPSKNVLDLVQKHWT